MVLFYADVLGMKSRWTQGVEVIRKAYDRLEHLVDQAFMETGTAAGAAGAVQSDAVAVTFPAVEPAVRFARSMFLRTFLDADHEQRFWMRGLLMSCPVRGNALATEAPIGTASGAVTSRQFCDELLGAINIEQSFKGPRLLIAGSLISEELREGLALPVGKLFVIPLRHLTHSGYPDASWQDVLYLYPEELNDAAVQARGYEIGQRQRWASATQISGSREEFEQVSHLALAWTECEALYHATALRSRVSGTDMTR